MRRRSSIFAFLADETGAAAVEFALVSILFLGLMVGTIDVARLLWEVNSAKAATRAAARYAAVNQPVAQDLVNFNAVTTLGLAAGEPVPASSVGTYTCTSAGCTCTGSANCGAGALNTTVFNNIVALMQAYYGRLTASNVIITYTPIGLGFAGNPYGPDVEPLVTVQLTGVQFAPGALQAFGISPFNMPPEASSLSGEDLS
jgi:Flp pilus assembly protein TadG